MKVYLMELVQGTSKTGNPYTRAVLMDDNGRRQSFFLDAAQTKDILEVKEDVMSKSMTELVPLEAEIDPFAGRLISIDQA